MSKEIMKLFEGEELGVKESQVTEYLNAMRAMGIAKDLNASQTYTFLKYCFTLKLNPLLKQIHCVTYKNRDGTTTMTPIISYSEYIKKAERSPYYQLPELTMVDRDKDGKLLPLDQVYIIARVKRKGDETTLEKVFYMNEWKKNQGLWLTQPKHMLHVRAMKNILALAYPSELADYEAIDVMYEVEMDNRKNKKFAGVFNNEDDADIKAQDDTTR